MDAAVARTGTIALILVFTLLSGLADSQGFLHSAWVWNNGQPVWQEMVKASLGYGFGALFYWFAIRYLNQLASIPPEVQTLGWFAVTIAGVALFSGGFLHWQPVDRLVAVAVLAGVGWLVIRTGG